MTVCVRICVHCVNGVSCMCICMCVCVWKCVKVSVCPFDYVYKCACVCMCACVSNQQVTCVHVDGDNCLLHFALVKIGKFALGTNIDLYT